MGRFFFRGIYRGGQAVVLALALLLATGCDGGGRAFEGAPVILISIDTLRSDRLPAYGYDAIATPAISGLARDGVLFERAFSHVPLTLPSHLTMLTGRLPHRHGVRSNAGYTVDLKGQPYLVRRLAGAGYATGGAVSAFPLSRPSGFGDGFDFFDDADGFARQRSAERHQRPGSETLRSALPWLRETAASDRPFFFFFHLFEPHTPYEPPAGPGSSPYDAEIVVADQLVGALLDELRTLGVYDRAMIFLVSDHGEGLGDHGESEHGMLLYREVLQVPWIVKLPQNAGAGRRVEAPAGLVDVLPTVLELVGLDVPAGLDGKSQASALLGKSTGSEERILFAETLYPRLEMGWGALFSATRGDHHLVEGPRPELFDRSTDPGEQNDLLQGEVPAEARRAAGELSRALDDEGAAFVAAGQVSDEAAAALESLGYVGSAGGGEDPSVAPQDHIEIYETYRSGRLAVLAEDWPTAERYLREALAAAPDLLDARLLLGRTLDRLDRSEEALEAYLVAGPLSDRPVEIAGEVLGLCRRLGRLDACPRLLGRFVDAQPAVPRLRYLKAKTLRELGRHGEALVEAEAALAMAPEDPDAHYLRGTIFTAEERLEEARADLERALELSDERHLPAMVDLGMVLHDLGEEEAARRWIELARFAAPDDPSVRAAAERLQFP